MAKFDPNNLKFGPRIKRKTVLAAYMELVANGKGLLSYKNVRQHGGKRGESLYTHVLNGIMLLDALRELLALTELETRLLFTVFTMHDINKDPDFSGKRYSQIAIPDNFTELAQKLKLDEFFPDYAVYLSEITQIAAQHGRHSGGVSIMARPNKLPTEHVAELLALIRAVDTLDLSHTLDERSHKATFLSELNSIIPDRQYTFFLHRLTENRGSLSNLMHEAIVTVLKGQGAVPLLYYPDGVAYLVRQDDVPAVGKILKRKMARQTAVFVNELTGQEFSGFIKSGIQGIKVDPKCLELGLPFSKLWNVMYGRVQTRSLNRDDLLPKIQNRTERTFEKNAATDPEAAQVVRARLDNPETLLPASADRLRDGELIRTYYIFLNTHFKDDIPDAWAHIYDLLDIPAETRNWLAFFDARWDRPYVLMTELSLGHEAINERIEEDGSQWVNSRETADDKEQLFAEYLDRYALFGLMGQLQPPANRQFGDHLQEYVQNQHKQCVHCSAIFPTDKWMTNDVRSDITVQTFSNRLRGGPGEPKKYICRLCQLQFLVERLNYEEVRGEKTMYLHLFPYSFLPAPYLTALRDEVDEIRRSDTAVRALWCDAPTALVDDEKGIDPQFATQTKKGKPHPYGLYMPRIAQNTIGNQLIFPFNPAGENDSQRFLFALWYALVLQKHFGLRVMLTESPVAPFVPEVDLYIDNVALSCRGLVARNDYPAFADLNDPNGDKPLNNLYRQAQKLHQIVNRLRTTSKKDEMLALVQAMADGPLHLYYTAEKLLEARVRGDQKASSPEWLEIRLSQQIFPDLQDLIEDKGGHLMAQLSEALQSLAEIAWQGGLRGKSLKKNSLMMPLDEIFQKLNQRSRAFDEGALKATIAEDIFEYLERIADEYAPGRRKMESATNFVDTFFNDVFHGIYQANTTRLLADEKLLRSAFMFYIRQQIPQKQKES